MVRFDLISKEINCAQRNYMNMSTSLIELATPLLSVNKVGHRYQIFGAI